MDSPSPRRPCTRCSIPVQTPTVVRLQVCALPVVLCGDRRGPPVATCGANDVSGADSLRGPLDILGRSDGW